MTSSAAKKPKQKKRRIQTSVSEHDGKRLDRLAKAYGEKEIPGSDFRASVALTAAVHAGLKAEEKRLGLPPLPESPTSPKQVKARGAARRRRGETRHA